MPSPSRHAAIRWYSGVQDSENAVEKGFRVRMFAKETITRKRFPNPEVFRMAETA
jgi:hypothetical protein